jgi:hypothetical protein
MMMDLDHRVPRQSARVADLYRNPTEQAVVLCVDEIRHQAPDRSQPVLPERRSHDYVRHGTTNLFAAFNIAGGTVISELHRHHQPGELRKFLARIDKTVPARLGMHLACDNLATHKYPVIHAWLARRPRFRLHFTPTGSSSINQVERVVGRLDRSDDPPWRAQERAGPRSRHPRLHRELESESPALHLD